MSTCSEYLKNNSNSRSVFKRQDDLLLKLHIYKNQNADNAWTDLFEIVFDELVQHSLLVETRTIPEQWRNDWDDML